MQAYLCSSTLSSLVHIYFLNLEVSLSTRHSYWFYQKSMTKMDSVTSHMTISSVSCRRKTLWWKRRSVKLYIPHTLHSPVSPVWRILLVSQYFVNIKGCQCHPVQSNETANKSGTQDVIENVYIITFQCQILCLSRDNAGCPKKKYTQAF